MPDANLPNRSVLKGVPRVNFYRPGQKRCPEDVPLAACLRATLEHLGEGYGCRHLVQRRITHPSGCTYAYVLGASGLASALSWHATAWDPAGTSADVISEDPREPFRRAYAAVGYACEFVGNADIKHDPCYGATCLGNDAGEAEMRARMMHSIAVDERPVIAFGVVGPPAPALITGYDEGGDVLIGWSFFQDEAEFNQGVAFEPNGTYRKRDWYADTSGVILMEKKIEPPPAKEAIQSALDWMVQVSRTPRVHCRHNGLAAYTAWAKALLNDETFATQDPGALCMLQSIHSNCVGALAEFRWYGSIFLAQAAQEIPNSAAHLFAAASCYAEEHDLMWKVWGEMGGLGQGLDFAKRLADPDVRRRSAELIRQARALDETATEHMEQALAHPAQYG